MRDGENQSGRSRLAPNRAVVAGGLSPGVDFISSVIAGMALGFALDWWLGTKPVFVIIGVLAGFVSGFVKLWRYSAVLEELAKERARGF